MKAGSLAQTLWGLDWQAVFPRFVAGSKIRIAACGYEDFRRFADQHFPEIYGNELNQQNTILDDDDATKRRRAVYYTALGDFFLFFDEGRPIGGFACTVADWRTYYLRSSGLLKEYQGRGIYKDFIDLLLAQLDAHGVECVTAEVSPANLTVLNVLNKRKFNITGINNSDRFGSLVVLTRFLHGGSEEGFLNRFCVGVYPQLGRMPSVENC